MLYVPLPKCRIILAALLKKEVNLNLLAKFWSLDKSVDYWFSRSAWSLYSIVEFRKKVYRNKRVKVMIPDYFCNSALEPIRKTYVDIIFYPIKQNGKPNFSVFIDLISKSNPDIIIFVNYFGVTMGSSKMMSIAKKYDAWLVEDSTHCLMPQKDIGNFGDFVLYSPHKSLAIPDGALMIIRESGPSHISKDFIRKEKFDQIYNSMISNEPKIRSFLWIWLAKRLLQKLGVSNKMRSVKFDNKLKEQGCRKMVHPKMSNFSARLLNRMVSKLDIERKARKENFLAWQSRLFKITEVSLIYQYNQVSTPYLSVHSMPNLVTAKRVFESLNSIGLPVTTWPDLPPEVLENKKMHGDAIKMRYTQLFLPVHSSIENKKIYSIRIEG